MTCDIFVIQCNEATISQIQVQQVKISLLNSPVNGGFPDWVTVERSNCL